MGNGGTEGPQHVDPRHQRMENMSAMHGPLKLDDMIPRKQQDVMTASIAVGKRHHRTGMVVR